MTEFTLTEIERGHGFISVWGYPYPDLCAFAELLWDNLPEELKEIQPKNNLLFHSPPLFHPYGQGPETGRRNYKHFHILYPNEPTEGDIIDLILRIQATGYARPMAVTELEDHMDPSIDMGKGLARSVQIYNKIMSKHND